MSNVYLQLLSFAFSSHGTSSRVCLRFSKSKSFIVSVSLGSVIINVFTPQTPILDSTSCSCSPPIVSLLGKGNLLSKYKIPSVINCGYNYHKLSQNLAASINDMILFTSLRFGKAGKRAHLSLLGSLKTTSGIHLKSYWDVWCLGWEDKNSWELGHLGFPGHWSLSLDHLSTCS